MRAGLILYFAGAVSALPATARAQARAAPVPRAPASIRRAAGCYQVLPTEARGDSVVSGRDSVAPDPFVSLPTRFELTDTALASPLDGWYALHPATIYAPQKMFATWQATAPDSVVVAWSTGFNGLGLDLSIRGDSLVGFVEPISDSDVRGQRPLRRPVLAMRVACKL